MKKRIGFLFLLIISLLIGCTSNAATDNEQNEVEQEQNEVEQQENDLRVVTIQEKTFDKEDLAFYTVMNQIKLILQIDIAEGDDTIAYLEEQRTYYDNINVNLQSMIELYAMSLLAEEKNYFVPEDKLQTAIKKYNEKVSNVAEATKLIEEYGQEKYNRNIEEYIQQTILRDRIAKELEEELLEENPDAGKEEINYLLEDKFEDLLMAQIASLDMDIHLQ